MRNNNTNEQCHVALYIRLSLADEDTGFSKVESDSIGNQRLCLHRFLDESKDLAQYPRQEFADDGFTATNGNRPSFTAMMDKVQAGEINIIIVRDFSRFFRDYVEAGNYLECVFPFLGVRFISINDNYDSDGYKGTTGGLEMVMRNIIYASYSKDLSVKTTTAKIHMMKQGKYVGGYAPYGYQMHDTIKHKLTIDPTAASVIRRIFDEALSGTKTIEIARSLNRDGVPTMSQYFKSVYPNTKKFSRTSDKAGWSVAMIHRILQKYLYTGAMVSHKRKSAGLGNRKTIANAPIIVEDMHEAIVTKEEFARVQALFGESSKKGIERQQSTFPLKSLIRCGNCKRSMARHKRKTTSNLFRCEYVLADENLACSREYFAEDELERLAYNAITQYVDALHGVTSVTQKASKTISPNDKVISQSTLQSQIEGLKRQKIRLYENYTTGTLTQDMFLKQKSDADAKIAELNERIQELHTTSKEDNTAPHIPQASYLQSLFAQSDKLTYELAHAFIKAIYIHSKDSIEIEWKFADLFTDTLKNGE